MKIVIEFYRVRPQDDAHALVGRESADVIDLDAAIATAAALARSLDMPQQPDAVTILDEVGRTLHVCSFDAVQRPNERRSP